MSNRHILVETRARHWDSDTSTTILFFPKDRSHMDGRYHIRGGVCWPATVSHNHGEYLSGYVAVLGIRPSTMATYLFGLQEFQTISNVLDSGGRIQFEGVHTFLNSVAANFFCDTFYWWGDREVTRNRLREIEADRMILVKPGFPEVRVDDAKQFILAIPQAVQTRRIFIPSDTAEGEALHGRIRSSVEHLDTPGPDLWAIAAAYSGICSSPPDRD